VVAGTGEHVEAVPREFVMVCIVSAVHHSYQVKKEVGRVGEDSPLFIVPINSAENKSNIANFFQKGMGVKEQTPSPRKIDTEKQDAKREHTQSTPVKQDLKREEVTKATPVKRNDESLNGVVDTTLVEDLNSEVHSPAKRKVSFPEPDTPTKIKPSPVKMTLSKAKSPKAKSPTKKKEISAGGQKITKFFSAK
jgi:hypothetical protein